MPGIIGLRTFTFHLKNSLRVSFIQLAILLFVCFGTIKKKVITKRKFSFESLDPPTNEKNNDKNWFLSDWLGFLVRATEGTSLYVWVRQLVSYLVSQLVSAFLFFKTHIRVLLDYVGSRDFAWKLYILVNIHPTTIGA